MVSLTSLHENVSYLGVASLVAPLVAQTVKNPPAMQKTQVPSLGWEDSLEKELATHSSILAWRISWTEDPGGLQSTGVTRVRHDLVTKLHTPTLHQKLVGKSSL